MRSPVLFLTWHLSRSSGRRGVQSRLLAAGAAAVGAFVLLVIAGAALGSGTRADRTAWRTPSPPGTPRRSRRSRRRTCATSPSPWSPSPSSPDGRGPPPRPA